MCTHVHVCVRVLLAWSEGGRGHLDLQAQEPTGNGKIGLQGLIG